MRLGSFREPETSILSSRNNSTKERVSLINMNQQMLEDAFLAILKGAVFFCSATAVIATYVFKLITTAL